jgi:hypothetical protein
MLAPLLATLLLAGAPAKAPPAPDGPLAPLRPLVGRWEAKAPGGKKVRVSYRFLANESALVETFTTATGKETLTVFHPDGARVLATHYCAQGNQPRLARTEDSTPARARFVFVDATNLAPGASHLTALELRPSKAALVRVETYTTGATSEETTLRFRKAR